MNTANSTHLLEVHQHLCQAYGAPFPYFSSKKPIEQLISALLSHRTRNHITASAYRALRQAFPDWNDLIDAPTHKVEALIAAVTYPEQKAKRIPEALKIIRRRNQGRLSLDFLTQYSSTEARAWLEQLPGVGAKTSAAVLNFSTLRLPALVVDTHHLRVAQRMGFVPDKISLQKAAYYLEELLPKHWGGQEFYDHHEAFMYHGQRCCHYRNPDCATCPVQAYCTYYQQQPRRAD